MKGMSSMGGQDAEMTKYRTESDLRTMQECEAIKNDPKRMKACMEMAKQRLAMMKDVAGDMDDAGAKPPAKAPAISAPPIQAAPAPVKIKSSPAGGGGHSGMSM
jgi:hypothetical protein